MRARHGRQLMLVGPPVALSLFGIAAWGETIGLWTLGLLPLGHLGAVVIASLGLYLSVIVLYCVAALADRAATGRQLVVAQKRGDYLQRKNHELQAQIELLTAMREVTRVVTNDVDFERILEQVLRIVEDLLETRSITIYLADATAHGLAPQAQRQAGATYFGHHIESHELDTGEVAQSFHTQSVLRYADDRGLHLLLPLRADRECLGVLELAAALDGTPDAKAAIAEQLERQARDMAEHIAVAIKTSHLHDKAIIDGLTKLYTKRHFLEQLAANLNLAARHHKALSLIMVDIDHFKQVNDTHGHLTGDSVLVDVAQMLKKMLRRYDAAFRYGGEELAVILPETDCTGAAKLAERARERLEGMTFKAEDGRSLKVTASFGVAARARGIDTPGALTAAADRALYQAKESGRNRVCVAAEQA